MAFSFKNSEENNPETSATGGDSGEQNLGRPQPILHKPKGANPLMGKMGIMIGAAVVLLVIGFFAFRWFKNRKPAAPPPIVVENVIPQATDTTTQTPEVTPPYSATSQPPQTPAMTDEEGDGTMKKSSPPPEKKPAIATKEKKKEPVKEASPPPPPAEKKKASPPPQQTAPVGTGEFTIYIGAFKSKINADDLANRWNEAGYQAFITEKKGFYRVSIGKYSSKAEAKEQAEKLKDGFESGYWVDKF